MSFCKAVGLAAGLGLLVASLAPADNQGVGTSGGWVPRVAVKPDPSKIMVPGSGITVAVAPVSTKPVFELLPRQLPLRHRK